MEDDFVTGRRMPDEVALRVDVARHGDQIKEIGRRLERVEDRIEEKLGALAAAVEKLDSRLDKMPVVGGAVQIPVKAAAGPWWAKPVEFRVVLIIALAAAAFGAAVGLDELLAWIGK